MRYRDVVTPGGGLDGLPGFHVKSEKFPHSTHFLKWEEGVTVFRAYPAIENGSVMPMRYSEHAGDFTPWFVAVRMVKMFGVNDKFTCLAHVKGKPFSARGPIDYFADEMHKAVGKNSTNVRDFPREWEEWVKGSKGKGAKLSEVSEFGLMQGMLFENGKKRYLKEGRPDPVHPVVLCITKSARWQLGKLCDAEVEGYNGHPEDWVRRFKIGDVISPDAGRLLEFYTVPRTDEVNARYGVKSTDVVRLPLELLKSEWYPWEDLLVFLSEEEQMELLIRSFPAAPLDFVFSGSMWEEFLPAKVKGSHLRAGAPVHQQYPQPLPVYAPPHQAHEVSYPASQQPQMQPPAYVPVPQPQMQPPAYVPVPQPQTQPPAYVPVPQPQTQSPVYTYAGPAVQPVLNQPATQPPAYVPPPPPPGYAVGGEQPFYPPAGTQPPAQPAQPPVRPQQPSGDPSAVSGIFINAMDDLRASQATARQGRETPPNG